MDYLKRMRKQIDKIDAELVKILAKRFKITKQIRKYKKINKLPLIDRKRENYILETKVKLAKRLKLDSDLTKNIFMLISGKTKKTRTRKIIQKKLIHLNK